MSLLGDFHNISDILDKGYEERKRRVSLPKTLVSRGWGPQRLNSAAKLRFRGGASEWARNMMRSPQFVVTNGVTYRLAVIMHKPIRYPQGWGMLGITQDLGQEWLHVCDRDGVEFPREWAFVFLARSKS
jgi:hypothetical protein